MTSSLEPDLCPPPKSHRFPLKLDLQQYLMGRIEHFQLALQPRRNTEPGKLWEKKTPNPVLVSYENENHQCINVAIIFTHHTKLLASAAPWNDHQLQLSNGVSTAACKMRPGNQLVRPQFFPTSTPFANDHDSLIPCWYQYFLYNLTCPGKVQRPTIENVERLKNWKQAVRACWDACQSDCPPWKGGAWRYHRHRVCSSRCFDWWHLELEKCHEKSGGTSSFVHWKIEVFLQKVLFEVLMLINKGNLCQSCNYSWTSLLHSKWIGDRGKYPKSSAIEIN